jgi:hypothetical protein
MPGSGSIHIVTSLVNNRNNITKRKEIIRDLQQNPEKQRLQTSQAIDWGCVHLAPSFGHHTPSSSSSEQRFSKDEYTYGWYSARPQKLTRKQFKIHL